MIEKGARTVENTHTRLLVSKFKECFAFYRDVMGFPVMWGDESGTYASFDVGDHILALFMRDLMAEAIGAEPPRPRPEQQDYVCLTFDVQDVDTAYQTLKHKGADPITEPHDREDWGVRCFHLRDPDGNLIEVNRDFGLEDG
jgi:catechol 2,3-dioxygenase-like lactoylglutathione lyase family enzyme